MTREDQKESFKWLLLIFGFLFLAFIFFLYLGGDFMKASCVVKIICISFLLMALTACIICAFCCNPEDSCPSLKDCMLSKKCNLNCNTGFTLIHGSKKSYTVTNYDSFKEAFEGACDGDVLYVFDDELSISQKQLSELFSKSNEGKKVTLKIMKSEQDLTVHLNK